MQSTPGRSLAVHQRLYRTMLLAYPRAFRQVYGADMVQVFGDRLREERERHGRRASVGVWFLTLLDLFKTAPLQRMEKKMTREAAFAVMFALLAVAVSLFTMGIGGPVVATVLGLLILTALALGVTGVFSKKDSRSAKVPAGKLGLKDWWVVLAGFLGASQILLVVVGLSQDPTFEKVFAVVIGIFGALTLAGVWVRMRSRTAGDWMIVLGFLPFTSLFWAIWPPILGVVVIVMAIIDTLKGRDSEAAAA
jgi:hypothetical protein